VVTYLYCSECWEQIAMNFSIPIGSSQGQSD